MSDPSNHELLSAYLDGELSADERQRVERLLADDADCRRVYEELRALRSSLSELPRHRLDEDLAPHVLRLAEEALREKQSAEREVVPSSYEAADRRARRWRTLIYPLAVAAAAVAMLVSSNREKHRDQLARGPEREAPVATVSAAPPAANAPAPAAKPDSDAFAADRALKLPPAHDNEKTKKASPARDDKGPADEQSAGVGRYNNMLDAAAGEKETVDADAADAIGSDESIMPVGEDLNRAPESQAKANPYQSKPRGTKRLDASPPGSRATLIVECTLAPAAVRDKAFDLLLARNHLAAAPAGPAARANGNAAADSRKDAGHAASKPALEADRKMAEKDKRLPAENSPSSLGISEKPSPRSVMVEMQPEQLVAVLTELQRHPDQFVSVQLPGKPSNKVESDSASTNKHFATVELDEVDAPADAASEGTELSTETLAAAAPAVSGPPQRLLVLFRLSEAPGR